MQGTCLTNRQNRRITWITNKSQTGRLKVFEEIYNEKLQ